MKIVPLGTSSGQPTMERGVSGLAAFVGSQSKWVLIDCGEGTHQTILRAGPLPRGDGAPVPSGAGEDPAKSWRLRLADLEAICITHAHGDHCFGLFGVLAGLEAIGRSKELRIVAPGEAKAMAEAVLSHSHTPLSFQVDWIAPEDGLVVELAEGLSCRCVAMKHRAPSHGYLLESSVLRATADHALLLGLGFKAGPAMGAAIAALKRGEPAASPSGAVVEPADAIAFERVSESLFVGGDNIEPERVAQAAAGAIAWVHEATYLHEDWERGGAGEKWGHSSARMVGAAARMGAPGALVLTHFSPRYGEGSRGVDLLAQEAALEYGGPVHIATDLVSIEFAPKVEPAAAPAKAPKAPGP